MTVMSANSKAGPYTRNGIATAYPFTFVVFKTADVMVVKTNLSAVESTLAEFTDYTVALNADQDASPGGTVTMTSVGTAGELLTLTSNIAATQEVDIQSAGGFYPDLYEAALDKLTKITQQLDEKIGRAIKINISSSNSPDALMASLNAAATSAAASAAAASAAAAAAAASAAAIASGSQTITSIACTGGAINGTTIGATTPASGVFTTLQATGGLSTTNTTLAGRTLTVAYDGTYYWSLVQQGAGGVAYRSMGGTGAHDFETISLTNIQLRVLHTANANRYLTATGSNGGAPAFGTSGGDLSLTSATGTIQTTGVMAATGSVWGANGTATPAGGAVAKCLALGSAAIGIYWGSGAPTVSAAQGSLYIRTDGGASTRLYSNNNGSTGWSAITSA